MHCWHRGIIKLLSAICEVAKYKAPIIGFWRVHGYSNLNIMWYSPSTNSIYMYIYWKRQSRTFSNDIVIHCTEYLENCWNRKNFSFNPILHFWNAQLLRLLTWSRNYIPMENTMGLNISLKRHLSWNCDIVRYHKCTQKLFYSDLYHDWIHKYRRQLDMALPDQVLILTNSRDSNQNVLKPNQILIPSCQKFKIPKRDQTTL